KQRQERRREDRYQMPLHPKKPPVLGKGELRLRGPMPSNHSCGLESMVYRFPGCKLPVSNALESVSFSVTAGSGREPKSPHMATIDTENETILVRSRNAGKL